MIGCGGIGVGAIQGARITGAEDIVAFDLVASKREQVLAFGATHFVTRLDEASALVGDLTRGVMADSAILTTGVVRGSLISPALDLVRKAGTAVVTGIAPATDTQVDLSLFVH